MWKIAILLCCVAVSSCLAGSDQTRFTLDFFKSAYNPRENSVLSPLSLQVGLSMMHHVATPDGVRLMQEGLHIPADNEVLTRQSKDLLDSINNQEVKAVSMSSKVYYPEGAHLNPEFIPPLEGTFNATTEAVNFGQSDLVVQRVNSWVNESTRGAIRDLLQRDDISEKTTSLLVNVVTLKAGWGFKGVICENRTRKQIFHFLNGDHEVDMMLVDGDLPRVHLDDIKLDAFELSYERGTDLSMVILLPRIDTTLETALQRFTIDHYRQLDELLVVYKYWGKVLLRLPRFSIKQKLAAEETLRKLGVGDLFDEDLFQVLPGVRSRLGNVRQSAFIKVDENGTEAAAATSIASEFISGSMPIDADRPFLFLIRKISTKDILFIGHYSNFEKD